MRNPFATSLQARLATLIVLAVVLPTMAGLLFTSYSVAEILNQNAQEGLKSQASALAGRVSDWDEATKLTVLNLSKQPDIVSMEAKRQNPILIRLGSVYTTFYAIVTTDLKGKNIGRSDNLELKDYSDRKWFLEAIAGKEITRQTIIGKTNNKPSLCMSTPIRDEQTTQIKGVVAVCADLTVLSEQVGVTQVGETGFAFLVDDQNQALTYPDLASSSQLKNLSDYPQVQALRTNPNNFFSFTDKAGEQWLSYTIPLSNGWGVVIQQKQAEVLAQVNNFWRFAVAITLLVTAAVSLLTWIVIGRSLRPIANLTTVATAISQGQLHQAITIKRKDELGVLANAFNVMAERLEEIVDELETRVIARTQRLEIVAKFSERLSSILDLDILLVEVINQIKENFGYYHAHIYLLDDQGEKLVMAEGTGSAGAEMKAKDHYIPLSASTSLVARAARTGQVVRVDNVREAQDWLPNPLLPDTYSEMAVPIIMGEQVVGVLDVQQNKIAGLDEGDVNMLRSLANQVAITIRNARLFQQVETALAEANQTQGRYIQQSWQKSKTLTQFSQYLYVQPNADPLDEVRQQALAKIQHQSSAYNHPTVVTFDDNGSEQKSLLAPINLRRQTIGVLQLYSSKGDQIWSEDDLEVIAAVSDQLAQAAENLRLFEEARERASREQTIREITEKMRTASTLKDLVKTATEELGQRFSAKFALVDLGIDIPAEDIQQTSKGEGGLS